MPFQIIHGNLLDSRDDAIILTVDGAAKGMEGNLARAFERKYADTWEEIQQDITYPVPLGQVVPLNTYEDPECPHRLVLIASTLHHLDVLRDAEKIRVIEAALLRALSLTAQKRYGSVATAVMTGGWRLPLCAAFESMLGVYGRFRSISPTSLLLKVYVMKKEEFTELERYLIEHNYGLAPVDCGAEIVWPERI